MVKSDVGVGTAFHLISKWGRSSDVLQPAVPLGVDVVPFGVAVPFRPFEDCRRLAGSVPSCEDEVSSQYQSVVQLPTSFVEPYRQRFSMRESLTSNPELVKLRLLCAAGTPFVVGAACAALSFFFFGRVGRISPSWNTSAGRSKLEKGQ